jgi:McKusick-Kaufman syndrome protein
MSSGIQVDRGTPATVQKSSLSVYRTSIHNLLTLARSCRTPAGHIKILQNTTGGSLTLTSSSKRLFASLAVKKPIIQLLVTAAQGHLGAYSDGGLFTITFATDLVLNSLDSSQNVKILAEIYEKLLFICLNYMRSEMCRFKYIAKVSDIRFMTNFVKSVLVTKPLCCLYDFNLDHIIRLVLETFLQCVSDSDQCLTVSDSVYSICTSGYRVTESRVVEGLLLLAPEYSRFKTSDIKPKYVNHNSRQNIKVAMVTLSLSGDLEELSDIDIEVGGDVSIDTVILEDLSGFCESLIQSEVGLVLCQKVVHPKLKLSLQSAGVVVVDRLGIQPIKFVTTLSGKLLVF